MAVTCAKVSHEVSWCLMESQDRNSWVTHDHGCVDHSPGGKTTYPAPPRRTLDCRCRTAPRRPGRRRQGSDHPLGTRSPWVPLHPAARPLAEHGVPRPLDAVVPRRPRAGQLHQLTVVPAPPVPVPLARKLAHLLILSSYPSLINLVARSAATSGGKHNHPASRSLRAAVSCPRRRTAAVAAAVRGVFGVVITLARPPTRGARPRPRTPRLGHRRAPGRPRRGCRGSR